MKQALAAIVAQALMILAGLGVSYAQDAKPNATLIQNVNIFDGKNEKLATGMSVLVEGNEITKIAESITAPAGATVIDAGVAR